VRDTRGLAPPGKPPGRGKLAPTPSAVNCRARDHLEDDDRLRIGSLIDGKILRETRFEAVR
jgi:hypothetical protein